MSLMALLASGILNDPSQYRGDARLLKARGLLTPDERPTVPVSPVDPGHIIGWSTILSRKDNKPLPIQVREQAGAVTPRERDHIYVNRKASEYRNKDLRQLAAVLAHEQTHIKEGKSEKLAYQKQMDVLKRLGVDNKELFDHLVKNQLLYGSD